MNSPIFLNRKNTNKNVEGIPTQLKNDLIEFDIFLNKLDAFLSHIDKLFAELEKVHNDFSFAIMRYFTEESSMRPFFLTITDILTIFGKTREQLRVQFDSTKLINAKTLKKLRYAKTKIKERDKAYNLVYHYQKKLERLQGQVAIGAAYEKLIRNKEKLENAIANYQSLDEFSKFEVKQALENRDDQAAFLIKSSLGLSVKYFSITGNQITKIEPHLNQIVNANDNSLENSAITKTKTSNNLAFNHSHIDNNYIQSNVNNKNINYNNLRNTNMSKSSPNSFLLSSQNKSDEIPSSWNIPNTSAWITNSSINSSKSGCASSKIWPSSLSSIIQYDEPSEILQKDTFSNYHFSNNGNPLVNYPSFSPSSSIPPFPDFQIPQNNPNILTYPSHSSRIFSTSQDPSTKTNNYVNAVESFIIKNDGSIPPPGDDPSKTRRIALD